MNIRTRPAGFRSLLALIAASSLCLGTWGCGGDPGATTSSTPVTQTKTVNGTLLGSNGSAQSSDKVVYDNGTSQAVSGQTDSAGKYVLIIPVSAITGSDTLTFFDSAAHELESVPVQLTPDTTAQSVTTTLMPPGPPTGV